MLVPALLTRILSLPCLLATPSTSARQDFSLVTSTSANSALPPDCAICFTAAAPFSALRPASTTVAPALASPSAMPRPIPPFPPVTMATRSVRSNKLMVPPYAVMTMAGACRPVGPKPRASCAPLLLVRHELRRRPEALPAARLVRLQIPQVQTPQARRTGALADPSSGRARHNRARCRCLARVLRSRDVPLCRQGDRLRGESGRGQIRAQCCGAQCRGDQHGAVVACRPDYAHCAVECQGPRRSRVGQHRAEPTITRECLYHRCRNTTAR